MGLKVMFMQRQTPIQYLTPAIGKPRMNPLTFLNLFDGGYGIIRGLLIVAKGVKKG